MLNHKEIGKNPEIIKKLSLLLININGKEQTFHQEKMIEKN